MELSRRDFVFGGIGGLASLLLPKSLIAKEGEPIVLPTLEEITALMSKEPNEILKSAIEKGEIKKFEYTRQTAPEDFYEFLNKKFKNKVVFVYLCTNEEDNSYDPEVDVNGSTLDIKYGRGPAITFLYTKLNLEKENPNVGFLFFEIININGEDDWRRLHNLFNVRRMGIPSTAEFKKTSEGYELVDIADTGFKEPSKILRHIKLWVDYATKK